MTSKEEIESTSTDGVSVLSDRRVHLRVKGGAEVKRRVGSGVEEGGGTLKETPLRVGLRVEEPLS